MAADDDAARAAREFLGGAPTLTLLGRGESVTHRVDAPTGTFLLRRHVSLHAPFDPTLVAPAAIASECAWLAALARDTQLGVPDPVPTPAGSFVLEADGACWTLLRWVEGESIEGQPSAEQAERLGALLAALHEHAGSWEIPADFVRPTHDRRWTREALRRLGELAADGIVAQADLERLTLAVELLEEELAPFAADLRHGDRTHGGLIHGDLHDENYVLQDGEVRPIDFGRCGFGPWLYDVAECAMHLVPDRRRDLLEAYGRARPLDDGDVRRIEGYLLAAVTETYGHHAPNAGEHAELARNLAAVADRHVRRYLEGRPFLLEV